MKRRSRTRKYRPGKSRRRRSTRTTRLARRRARARRLKRYGRGSPKQTKSKRARRVRFADKHTVHKIAHTDSKLRGVWAANFNPDKRALRRQRRVYVEEAARDRAYWAPCNFETARRLQECRANYIEDLLANGAEPAWAKQLAAKYRDAGLRQRECLSVLRGCQDARGRLRLAAAETKRLEQTREKARRQRAAKSRHRKSTRRKSHG